ncbi:MAG: exodeoxyribonuclease VII large subunit [Eubacteriales bacterium]
MQNVYTVAQLNTYIKNMFTQDYLLQSLFIKGEVSNCKYHSSGHIYFTLKDGKSSVACVMFARQRQGLGFQLQEGQSVIVEGNVDVYERDGKYQLYAKEIILDGAGLLYEKYEKLKNELEERGLFAPDYKRPIPYFNRTIGIVTAPTGAAVQDIIHIATRRNPYVQIILYPAIVQGSQAASSIVQGIRALELKEVDIIIVGRGGGSIEDLWAFNEEVVAQAIFDCSIPIISAVGHETDVTIADFVADMRAPTPSAAAELAVVEIAVIEQRVREYQDIFQRFMLGKLQILKMQLDHKKTRIKHLSPMAQIKEKRVFLMNLEEKVQANMLHILEWKKYRLSIYIERMKGLSPLEKLNQGFSYVADEQGMCIRESEQVKVGDKIQVQLRDGKLSARVETIERQE